MIANEFGIRLRNKADYAEKNAQIAKRRKVFVARNIFGGKFRGVVAWVDVSLLIGCSCGGYGRAAVGAEIFSVGNVGAASGTKRDRFIPPLNLVTLLLYS